MALSDAALAGIVVGVIFILTPIFGAIIYIKRRHHRSASPKDASLSSPTAPASPTLTSPPLTSLKTRAQENHGRYPSLENGPGPTFVARPARTPRSFNLHDSANFSSLLAVDEPTASNNPIIADLMVTSPRFFVKTPAASAITSVAASPQNATKLDTEGRPNTAVSTRPGSLHQAVLDVSESDAQVGVAGGIEAEDEKAKTEDASTENGLDKNVRQKGYSGVWP